MPKYPNRFWLAALLIAWAVDFLFYGKSPGVSFILWIGVLLTGTFLLIRSERQRISWLSILLSGFILLLGAIPFLRKEPFTVVIGILLSLSLLIVLAATLRSGNWLFYRVWDYLAAVFWLFIAAFSRPLSFQSKISDPSINSDSQKIRKGFWKGAAPIVRGLLLALPIIALLAALLASADLVFAQRLEKLLEILDIERLPEYIFRLFYILVLAYLFTGVLAHAVIPTKEVSRPGDHNKSVVKPFLGWTEAGIVLGCVDALFAFFVILQVQYLFGGQANISSTGFTYSEYARRGFGELVAVAVISLLLYLILGEITRRDTRLRQRGFSLLSVMLMMLVLVILASAFQRLLLYEMAYGFTRLRTYSFIFIPWLALLLVATIVLELLHRRGRFGPALLLAIIGFGLTFGAINIDGFITRKNVQRAVQGEEFDPEYINTLSTDAVPALVSLYQKSSIPAELQDEIGAVLACRQVLKEDQQSAKWQSFSISVSRAERLMRQLEVELRAYPVWQENDVWKVRADGNIYTCDPNHRAD
jgi:hypothetical protein